MSAPLSSSILRPAQFNLIEHYRVMAQLDADVHDNRALAESEVDTAIELIGSVPRRVFLPCFGTGRHIAPLLAHGVQRIVGVDLSATCVEKAYRAHCNDPRVTLNVGDLAGWQTAEPFDASIVLGNSFGDVIDPAILLRITHGMVASLAPSGVFVMDYIGTGYLDRCRMGKTVRWEAELNGRPVYDHRTPRYDSFSRIMSIDVVVTDRTTGEIVWRGTYQKLILTGEQITVHFATHGFDVNDVGLAIEVNPYYESHTDELGMIARSAWWVGKRA